jgi:hypothetical protein
MTGQSPRVADRLQDFLAAGLHDLAIDGLLRFGQLAIGNLLDLGRQIPRDLLFQSPQEKRPDPPGQPGLRLGIFVPGDGQFVALAKIPGRPEVAWH